MIKRLAGVAILISCLPAKADVQITASFSLTYDRIRPEPKKGVVTNQTIDVTLSGAKDVQEEGKRAAGHFSDGFKNAKVLGQKGAGVSWEVLGENQLRRTVDAPQSITVMTITVNGKNCSLDVSYSLKPGFKEFLFRRITDGTVAYFTQPKVLSTRCSIR